MTIIETHRHFAR